MHNNKLITAAIATGIMFAMTIPAFAGQWKDTDLGWWYDNGDGTYSTSAWQWIDGNNDGTAECYYFDKDGYCLIDTTTPDNYSVNADGAWTEDGVVQTKTMDASANTEQEAKENNTAATDYTVGRTTNVTSLEVKAESGFTRITSGTIANGEKWYNGFSLYSSRWVTYNTQKQYHTLTLTFAARENNKAGATSSVEVYGNDTKLLYKSDSVSAATAPQTVSIDISEWDNITIKNARETSAGQFMLFTDVNLLSTY